MLEQANQLRLTGKWKEAQACYEKVIELEPGNWLVHYHLGDALLNTECYTDAVFLDQNCRKLKLD